MLPRSESLARYRVTATCFRDGVILALHVLRPHADVGALLNTSERNSGREAAHASLTVHRRLKSWEGVAKNSGKSPKP